MHGAKLTISSRGAFILWDKVPWSNISHQKALSYPSLDLQTTILGWRWFRRLSFSVSTFRTNWTVFIKTTTVYICSRLSTHPLVDRQLMFFNGSQNWLKDSATVAIKNITYQLKVISKSGVANGKIRDLPSPLFENPSPRLSAVKHQAQDKDDKIPRLHRMNSSVINYGQSKSRLVIPWCVSKVNFWKLLWMAWLRFLPPCRP